MKRYLLLIILFSECKPAPYFISANQIRKEHVILELRNHQKIPGEITIPFENDFNSPFTENSHIEFIPDGKKEVQRINPDDVAGYSMGSEYFALKKIDIYMNNTNRLLFVKRLTSENSRLELYELYESGLGDVTREIQYSYYLVLPSFDDRETINTRSKKIIPLFDIKMSAIVADCPALAEKIRLKTKGYFLPEVTLATKKHPEVLLKIINEYDSCKSTR